MYEDLFQLEGKVALITGGAGGLGSEVAKGFNEYGASTVLVDLNQEELEKIAGTIRTSGYKGFKVKTISKDLTVPDNVKLMVEETAAEFGKIDILVNTVGINKRMPALALDIDEWDKIIDVNLKSVFLCCKFVGEIMVKQKFGKIINYGSVSSIIGHPNHSAYAASKGGVLLLTKVLAMEWAKANINVNAIGPAYIKTPLTTDYLNHSNNMEETIKTIPMGRLGSPRDVVGATIFLASSASDFITGTILMVDGGRTAD